MPYAPALSVIIPTRDRFKYAQHAVRAVLSAASGDYELVVHDNGSSSELASWIQGTYGADSRLRYRRITKPLSITENFEEALEFAAGEYICFIGDDDGVSPEIGRAARWARDHDLDAVLPSPCASYSWPDFRLRYGGQRDAGQLHLRPFTGQVTWCDAEKELLRCVKSGGQDFGNLPRVYYGIVRRQCIERVRETCGRYLPGISPDMAGSVAVASFVKRMCLVDYPLFVPGKSGGSASGLGAMKKHIGKLEDQAHLSREFIETWPDSVPRFFAGSTMWAAAAIQALEATGRSDLLQALATARLHALTAALEPHWTSTVVHNFHIVNRRQPSKYVAELFRFMLYYANGVGRRAKSLVANRTRTGRTKRIHDVQDIYEATVALARHAAQANFPFDESPPQKLAA